MKLSAEDRASLAPEEIAALEGAGAEEALNTMGDTVLPGPDAPDDKAAGTKPVESDSTGDGADAADDGADAADDGNEGSTTDAAAPAAQAAAEPDAPPPPPAPKPFKVPNLTDAAEQRKALRAEKRDLMTKWSAGELSDDEYATQVDEVDEKLAQMLVQTTRAATLQEVNEQNMAEVEAATLTAENEAMSKVATASKAAGHIDYSADGAAAAQFDALFAAAKLDPANAKLTALQVVEKAHKAVLALRGIAASPAAAPAADPTPQPRRVPPSIGGVPNASQTVVQDDIYERFRTLSGEDAERFMAGLSDAQVAKLMRTADNMGLAH